MVGQISLFGSELIKNCVEVCMFQYKINDLKVKRHDSFFRRVSSILWENRVIIESCFENYRVSFACSLLESDEQIYEIYFYYHNKLNSTIINR